MTAETILRVLTAWDGSQWGSFAMKTTACLAAGLLFVRAARRGPASLRHLLVVATFGMLLLLPATIAVVPARVVRIPVASPPHPARASAETSPRTSSAAVGSVASGLSAFTSGRSVAETLLLGAVGLYLGVAAGLALSLAGGVRRLRRLHRAADVSVEGTRLANEMARAHGIPTGIQVAVSDDLAIPFTFGALRPVILLPVSVRGWGDLEVRRAIRHELEHIDRRDWAAQTLTRLISILYWPHPLVWVLWKRLRIEAERACDDAVIRGSDSAAPYAEQLVSLARRLSPRDSVPALAMAARTSLGVRVEAILDRRLRRAPRTRASAFAAAAVAAVSLLGIAPFRVVTAAVRTAAPDRSVDADDADPLDRALMIAAASDDLAAMKRMLDRGARPNAAIDGDGSALIAAARRGHLEAMSLLIASGADVNLGVPGDGNPLTEAARRGRLEAVRFLVEHGARIDEGIEGDGNALIMAAGEGRLEVVRFLVDHGASIEKVVAGDENALIHASEGGQADVVRFLIARGANVNARVRVDSADGGTEWRTPLRMARRGGHEEVVRILLAAGARDSS
jgi:beta-lactamase regulating signal transducer with metallopeptidase domain